MSQSISACAYVDLYNTVRKIPENMFFKNDESDVK